MKDKIKILALEVKQFMEIHTVIISYVIMVWFLLRGGLYASANNMAGVIWCIFFIALVMLSIVFSKLD